MNGVLVRGTMDLIRVLIVHNTYYTLESLLFIYITYFYLSTFTLFTIKNMVLEMSGKNKK